jgi:hypothetical protein
MACPLGKQQALQAGQGPGLFEIVAKAYKCFSALEK